MMKRIVKQKKFERPEALSCHFAEAGRDGRWNMGDTASGVIVGTITRTTQLGPQHRCGAPEDVATSTHERADPGSHPGADTTAPHSRNRKCRVTHSPNGGRQCRARQPTVDKGRRRGHRPAGARRATGEAAPRPVRDGPGRQRRLVQAGRGQISGQLALQSQPWVADCRPHLSTWPLSLGGPWHPGEVIYNSQSKVNNGSKHIIWP